MIPLDALMFRGDEFPRTLSVVGALYLFDGPLPARKLKAALESAANRFPRLRQRAVTPPLRMLLPQWADDPDFDVADQFREIAVAAPGSLADVLDVIRPLLAAPLEDDRPLWEALSLTGLDQGQGALFFRMSHALTDGQGALRLFDTLFGTDETRPDRQTRRTQAGPLPDPATLQAEALARMPARTMELATAALPALLTAARDAWGDPMKAAGAAQRYLASARQVLAPPCPPAPALAARSLERRCAVMTLPLPRLKQVARNCKASINDLYLAAITDALRRYQLAVGELPQDVPMAVPVDLRRGSEDAAGNYIGALNLVAPASEPDPQRRLAALRESMASGRQQPAIAAPQMIAALLARMPDVVFERLLGNIPRADVQASNIRGSQQRPVLAGRRVLAMYPFGPVPGVAAMFAMLSLADDCFVSVHFDAASFAEPETFAQCLRQAFAAVLGRGGPSAALDGPVLDHAPASRRVTRPARAGDGKVAARGGRAPRVRTRTQRT